MSAEHCPTCLRLYGQQTNVHHHLPHRAHDRRVERLLQHHAVAGGGRKKKKEKKKEKKKKDSESPVSLLTRITRALYSLGVVAHSYAFIALIWRWIATLKKVLPTHYTIDQVWGVGPERKRLVSLRIGNITAPFLARMRAVFNSPEGQTILRDTVQVFDENNTAMNLSDLFHRNARKLLNATPTEYDELSGFLRTNRVATDQDLERLANNYANKKGSDPPLSVDKLKEIIKEAEEKQFIWHHEGTAGFDVSDPKNIYNLDQNAGVRRNAMIDKLILGLFDGFWLFVISQVGADLFSAFLGLLLRAVQGNSRSHMIRHLGRILGAGISILVATHALGATTIVACIVSILALALEVARMWSANTRASVEIAADIGQGVFAALGRLVGL